MLDNFFKEIKTVFTWALIIFAIIIAIVIIVKAKEHFEYKARKQKHNAEMLHGVNKIKSASNQWSRDVKNNYMNYLADEYQQLQRCQEKPVGAGYATETVIMASINGRMEYFSVNLYYIEDLYDYFDNVLNN